MKSAVILDTPAWRITSYGNGVAYAVEDVRLGKSVHLQGEDASEFSNELHVGDREWQDVCADYAEVMA